MGSGGSGWEGGGNPEGSGRRVSGEWAGLVGRWKGTRKEVSVNFSKKGIGDC